MVDITIVADIPLFHTVAQTSATFVAIVAGFYTLKIVTLSNDKRRILQRIGELENGLQAKNVYLGSLKETEFTTINEWDEESVSAFVAHIYGDFFDYEQIDTYEDLIEWYSKYWNRPITENEKRILTEYSLQILEELEKKRDERKERNTLREAIRPLASVNDDAIHAALSSQTERTQFHTLTEKIRDAQAEILYLQKMKEYNQLEYKSIAYPKLIRFGFGSLVAFAILGVILPLTYEWWVIPLFTYYGYNYNVNLLVVVLFIIGLSITFVYIGAELYYAISLGKTKNNKRETQQKKG